ncbi:MAG: hypothetical protein EP314_00430 [Bacteroidetes bacterium]|nr:MAG: hypothetical protein EP314_00430 [Bacteroidota bacterium]
MARCVFFVLSFLLAGRAEAQDSKLRRFYMETVGGYGFPIVNDDLGSSNDLIGIADRLMRSDSTISVRPVQGTQGPGWQFSANIGYMFHPNIGLEGHIGYIRSNAILLGRSITPNYSAEHVVYGQRLDAALQLVFSFQVKNKWSLYSKSGVVIPLWGKSSSEITIDDREGRVIEAFLGIPGPTTHANVSIKASSYGKFSYGFQTRLGAGYDVLDWLTVFGEVNFLALSIRSKEDRAESISVQFINGQTGEPGLLITENDLEEIEKTTIFVNELTENSNNPEVNENADPSLPLEALMRKDNFNQFGVSLGLRFYIK